MRALLVSGIWPPDVGGPASHTPALASFLLRRGHEVSVVTTAETAPASEPFPVHWVSRRIPAGARHAAVAADVARWARHADVVYATSMLRRSAFGAATARRPLVVKVTTDEAFERARRTGLFSGGIEEFQRFRGGLRVRALRASRTSALRRARHACFPSGFLRDVALGWGLDAERMSVIPNPAPVVSDLPSREELRANLGLEGPTLGFAGRLVAPKALDVTLVAMARAADVELVILGEGPERAALERQAAALGLDQNVRFLGGGSRGDVLRLYRAVDAAVLSSAWENLPHAVVEALAVGTPVIATAVGGIPEVVHDEVNGLLVLPGDTEALGEAIRRFFSDDELRGRLAAAAAPSVAHLSEERLLGEVEDELVKAAR